MKSILILTFLILISCDTSGQKRYLVSPTSEVYEITSDQSALSLVRKLNGADRAAASGVCTDRATFGYPLTAFPVTQVYKTFPKDIIGQWFVAKATGTIDTVFWYMPGEINTYDSTLYSRIQQSNIGPDYGPGVRPGPYDPPCQSWGYWINTNDPDQGVAAFIEEATDTTWVSTINGPVPSVPPFNPEIWGWGGVALKARPGINYYDLGFLGAPFVTVGDKLFISFRVNFNPSYHQHLHWWELGSTEFALSGFRVTPSDEDYPSRSWKFNEHDYNIYDGAYPFCAGVPAESLKRGWIARGGMGPDSTDVLVYNMWYSMTVTSNTPPTIEYQERLPSTFSTAARPLQALITDCSPSWQWWAGVRSASIRYTVNGVEQPDILMNDLGGDVWEGIIPGQPPPAIMTYRIVATDLEGATSSGPPNSYSVIPFGNVWYDIDTGAACVTYDILSTGTTVPNSSFFLPSTANPGGSPTDDGTAGPFDMGSTYTIFGDTFRYAWIGVDGAIGLGKTPTDTVGITDFGGHQPNIFPPFDTARILDLPGAYISPFWADRVVEDSSGMYGRVVYGNEGDTCLFIVEWDSLAVAGPDTSYQDDARFRVILNRCTGSVEFQYDDMGNYGLDSANITGMQADSGALTGPDPASVTLNILGYPAGTRPHDNWCVKLYPTVGALVQNGWNMVALSALPIDENYSASVLFPGATSKFYCFPYTGTCPDALTQGRGYWMKFPEAGRYGRSAGTFFREVSVPVADKWNMIGGTSGFVDVGAIVPGGTSITTPFWGYGPEGYYIATTIQPGTGYWVKVAGAGTLRMTSLMSAPKPASRSAGELEFGSSGMIAFTDAAGRSQRLYIGDATRVTGDSGYFELPPEPPPGIFDVRFTSQKILEVYPRNPDPVFRREYPLQMRGAVYPVTLRWNMSGIAGDNLRVTVSDGIGESPLRQALEGSGSVRIRDPKTQTLLVTLAGSGGPPVSFSLDQNFPNPFNSTTVITFSTPERGQVRLSVYDILGREVRILVDEEREAGVQSVSFDAVGLASGIYTYRIVAGTESGAGKMLLLK